MIPEEAAQNQHRRIEAEVIDHSLPWAYFDGSAQELGCGGGAILHLSDTHSFKIQMGLGRGTNNYAEFLTAKFLIQYALHKHCTHLQLFGDSRLIVNWINKKHICNAYTLKHILDEIHRLITSFDSFTCHHIYREWNIVADHLSKEAAIRNDATWLICEEKDGVVYQHYHRPFIDPESI